jgi:hypothetical protein
MDTKECETTMNPCKTWPQSAAQFNRLDIWVLNEAFFRKEAVTGSARCNEVAP